MEAGPSTTRGRVPGKGRATKALYNPASHASAAAGPSNNGHPPLSDATLKRLEEVSRMHIALASQSIPEIPDSRSGSPPRVLSPQSAIAYGKQRAREDGMELSAEVMEDLCAGIEVNIAENPRIRRLRKKVVEALEDCEYDRSDGRWALIPTLLRIGVVAGGTRWLDARGDCEPSRLDHVLTGQNGGIGWCNAETEEEWARWEKKFDHVMRIRGKVEQWMKGVEPTDEPPPIIQEIRTKSPRKPTSKQKKPTAAKKDAAKDFRPLGFTVAKRNAAANVKPRPKLFGRGFGSRPPSPVPETAEAESTQERRAKANNLPIASNPTVSDFSFKAPSFPTSELLMSTPIPGLDLGKAVERPPSQDESIPGLTAHKRRPTPVSDAPVAGPSHSSPSVIKTGGIPPPPIVAPMSDIRGGSPTPTRLTGKRKVVDSPLQEPDNTLKKARVDTTTSVFFHSHTHLADQTATSSELLLLQHQPSEEPPMPFWPSTPQREPLPRLIDLLTSAKKEKKEMRKRRKQERRKSMSANAVPSVCAAKEGDGQSTPLRVDQASQADEFEAPGDVFGAIEVIPRAVTRLVDYESQPPRTDKSKGSSPARESQGSVLDGISPPSPPATPLKKLHMKAKPVESPMRIVPPSPPSLLVVNAPPPALRERPPVEEQPVEAQGEIGLLDLTAEEQKGASVDIDVDNQHQSPGLAIPDDFALDLEQRLAQQLDISADADAKYDHEEEEEEEEHVFHDDDLDARFPEPDSDPEPDEHLDIVVPLRDHESEEPPSEWDMFGNDDDDDNRSIYAIETASNPDLSSPAKSLSSLAFSDSDDDDDDDDDDCIDDGGADDEEEGMVKLPEFDGDFAPEFASTQQPGGHVGAIFPGRSAKFGSGALPPFGGSDAAAPGFAAMFNSSSQSRGGGSAASPSKSSATNNNNYNYSGGGSGSVNGFGGGYNSQFDVRATIEKVDRLLEKDVDFDAWLQNIPSTGDESD